MHNNIDPNSEKLGRTALVPPRQQGEYPRFIWCRPEDRDPVTALYFKLQALALWEMPSLRDIVEALHVLVDVEDHGIYPNAPDGIPLTELGAELPLWLYEMSHWPREGDRPIIEAVRKAKDYVRDAEATAE